jgi:hypothetical protein
MTTIAYKDGTLATDSAMSAAGTWLGSVQKVFVGPEGGAVAVAGDTVASAAFKRWARAGFQGEIPDPTAQHSAVWAKNDGTLWIVEAGEAVRVTAPFLACGSGTDIAMGAMAAGATAEEAVMIACTFDLSSETPVVSHKIELHQAEVVAFGTQED